MTKKIYIIDWDEMIPKVKTGGLILGSDSVDSADIKNNIRQTSRIRKILNKMHDQQHLVVLIGREQTAKGSSPSNIDLAMLYVDALLGKNRKFLLSKDVYLYSSQKTEEQLKVIEKIILRFNTENAHDYMTQANPNQVVIVGNRSSYLRLEEKGFTLVSDADSQSYQTTEKKGFTFISTDDTQSYLAALENDLAANTKQPAREAYVVPDKSFWQKHKEKFFLAGVIVCTVLAGLLGLALTLSSVVFPPAGPVGGFLIGAAIGFAFSSIGFGTGYYCMRNKDSLLQLESLNNFSPIKNLSTVVIKTITNGVRKDAKNEEELPLKSSRRKRQDKNAQSEPLTGMETFKSPITDLPSYIAVPTKETMEKFEGARKKASEDKQELLHADEKREVVDTRVTVN